MITGKDRTKTMKEVTSEADFVSETGWVNIQVMGADDIKGLLRRLPEGQSVFWCDELHTGQSTETGMQLPPEEITHVSE